MLGSLEKEPVPSESRWKTYRKLDCAEPSSLRSGEHVVVDVGEETDELVERLGRLRASGMMLLRADSFSMKPVAR
jgi:hypothetical protein